MSNYLNSIRDLTDLVSIKKYVQMYVRRWVGDRAGALFYSVSLDQPTQSYYAQYFSQCTNVVRALWNIIVSFCCQNRAKL